MILNEALCNLRDELMTSGYFNRFYELAEVLPKGDESYPQVYSGNGQYLPIYDFDVNGSGYIRKNGSSYSDHFTDFRVMACNDNDPTIDLTIPLRLVAVVPKSKLNDDAFSDDKLALDLYQYIDKKQPQVESVSSLMGKVSSYQTDRARIWAEEVSGINRLLDLRQSVVAIDFTLTFRALLSCLQTNCLY